MTEAKLINFIPVFAAAWMKKKAMYEVIIMDDNVVIRMYTTNMGGPNLTFNLTMVSMQVFI